MGVINPRAAVVLAAGVGARLEPSTGPKCLLEVGGVSVLRRTLDCLAGAGVERVTLVVGHRRDVVEAALHEYHGARLRFVASEAFATTNNAWSLWLARDHLDQDTIVLDGDVVFDPELVERMLDRARAGGDVVSAVARWQPGMAGTVVHLDGDHRIDRMLLASDQLPGEALATTFKTINVHLLRRDYLRDQFVPRLDRLIAAGGTNEYYERAIADAVRDGAGEVRAADCSDLRWAEIDDAGDLELARYRFGTVDEQLELLRARHGGFSRLGVVDHSLPRNHHFPPPAMLEQLQAELATAIAEYPVGQATMQELLAQVVGLPAPQLVVANGASELIKLLGGRLGRTVVVSPAFNEYEAVFAGDEPYRYELTPPDFDLDIAALARAALAANARAVIVASPANPTSLAVPRADLLELAERLAVAESRLVVDESFVDFGAEPNTLEPDLPHHGNLVIVKSLSKAHGIGGLRLGYLATADLPLAAQIREALPIWNVNGLAEAFLRLLPAFGDQFAAAAAQTRRDCEELFAELDRTPGLRAYPPQANFVLVRVETGQSAADLVRDLLAGHQILIKDCAGKTMPDGERYLRVASRTSAENRRLVAALRASVTEPASVAVG